MSEITRIGVFGGAFDPPHVGHFICARSAAEQLGLSKVLVVPVGVHPVKPHQPDASGEQRLEMITALIGDDPLFEPDPLELRRDGPSWTVDTLTALRERYPAPDHELFLLMGMDSFQGLDSWKEPPRLFELAKVAVMNRGGIELDAKLKSRPDDWRSSAIFVSTPRIDVSASAIRRRCAAGLPVRFLVGREVEEVLRKHLLYQAVRQSEH